MATLEALAALVQTLVDWKAEVTAKIVDTLTSLKQMQHIIEVNKQWVDSYRADHESLEKRVQALEGSWKSSGADKFKTALVERRELRDLKPFTGEAKKYHGWKAQFELFLERYDPQFPELLRAVESSDEESLKDGNIRAWAANSQMDPDRIMDLIDELFHTLSMKTEGLPLAQVLNCQQNGKARGALAWKRITESAGGMSDSRKQGLINLVNNPVRVKTYAEVIPAMEELEKHFSELDRFPDAVLSEQARISSLRKLMPAELASNCMSQAMSLDTYQKLRSYVVLQCSLRRESIIESNLTIPPSSGRGATATKATPMEMHMGFTSPEDLPPVPESGSDSEGDLWMHNVGNGLLYAGPGGGKGGPKGTPKGGAGTPFNGQCHWCGQTGHRKSECAALTQRMNAVRAAEAAKGKGKDSGAKGGYGWAPKGGWKGAEHGKGKGGSWRPQGGPYGGASWSQGGKGKGMYEFSVDPWADAAINGMWGSELYNYDTACQQTAAAAPSQMFSLAVAPTPKVKTSNMFRGLEVSDEDLEELDVECEFPSLSRHPPEKVDTPRMTRWKRPSQVCRKVKTGEAQPAPARQTCGGCECDDAEVDKTETMEIEREAMRNLHYLGVNSGASEPMISHILGGHQGEWEEINAVMDSGAADSVAPGTIAENVVVTESTGSKSGQKYMTADGTKISNQGQKSFTTITEDGRAVGVTYQIADISRPLNSVGRICDKGNAVVFMKDGGYVMNLWSGERTRFSREEGVYILKTWVPRSTLPSPGASAPGFPRQG